MDKKIPAFLTDRKPTIQLILFTASFALIFINVFQPFNSRQWYPNISEFEYLFYSSMIILTGMLVVVISRLFMGLYTRRNKLNYVHYLLWVFAEVIAMSLFYALFSKFALRDGDSRDFLTLIQNAALNTGLVLLLPYSISFLYFSWKEKTRLLEDRVSSEASHESTRKGLIGFPDEKGELKITIALENLIYIDSADNYATIHYIKKDKISSYLIRNSLKWIDENLTHGTPLVRCHRSYMINLDKVTVLRKTKDGVFMELDAPNMSDMPVSKTYYDSVMEKFSKYTV